MAMPRTNTGMPLTRSSSTTASTPSRSLSEALPPGLQVARPSVASSRYLLPGEVRSRNAVPALRRASCAGVEPLPSSAGELCIAARMAPWLPRATGTVSPSGSAQLSPCG
jgi:hypothetical protein